MFGSVLLGACFCSHTSGPVYCRTVATVVRSSTKGHEKARRRNGRVYLGDKVGTSSTEAVYVFSLLEPGNTPSILVLGAWYVCDYGRVDDMDAFRVVFSGGASCG